MTREERNQIVMDHIKLVHFVAKMYAKRAKRHVLDYEDLVSEGTIGLIKAVENFDPSYGYALSTYAVPRIHGEIQALLRDYHRGPKFYRKIKNLRTAIVKSNLEDEQYDRIANELEASVKEVVSAMELIHGPLSFDYDIPNCDGDKQDVAFYEVIPGGADFMNDVILDAFISTLDERDKFIFVNTLDEKTQSEIGQALGISQVHVHRLLARIRMSLNEYLGRNVS